MNPYAKIENVPIPERETTLAILFYHGYTEHVMMHSTFLKVWIRETSLDPDAPWGEVAARLNWMSDNQIKRGWEEVCQHAMDLPVPDRFLGKSVDIWVSLNAEDGAWKSGWFMDGVSVVKFHGNERPFEKDYCEQIE